MSRHAWVAGALMGLVCVGVMGQSASESPSYAPSPDCVGAHSDYSNALRAYAQYTTETAPAELTANRKALSALSSDKCGSASLCQSTLSAVGASLNLSQRDLLISNIVVNPMIRDAGERDVLCEASVLLRKMRLRYIASHPDSSMEQSVHSEKFGEALKAFVMGEISKEKNPMLRRFEEQLAEHPTAPGQIVAYNATEIGDALEAAHTAENQKP